MSGLSPLARLEWLCAVAADARLSVAAIRVAAALARRQNERTGKLNPTVFTLAMDAGLTDRAVRSAVKSLEEMGWLAVNRAESGGRGRANSFSLHQPETLHSETVNCDSLNPKTVNGDAENPERPFRKTLNDGAPRTREVNKGMNKGSVPSKKREYSPEFEQAWSSYPKREGSNPKDKAFSAWKARIAKGHTVADLTDGVIRYASFCEQTAKIGTAYTMQASTFFGPSDPPHFLQAWTAAPAPTGRPPARPVRYQMEDF